jgi:hypothetical protein
MECGRSNGHVEIGVGETIKGENYDLCKLDRFHGGIPEMFVGTASH